MSYEVFLETFTKAGNLFSYLYISDMVLVLLSFVLGILLGRSTKKQEVIEEPNLEELKKELEFAKKPPRMDLSKYEQEQEEMAIISYDELVSSNFLPSIKYTSEDDLEGLLVKSIDVHNLVGTMDPKPISHPATYKDTVSHKPVLERGNEEEAFLITLKKLQNLID